MDDSLELETFRLVEVNGFKLLLSEMNKVWVGLHLVSGDRIAVVLGNLFVVDLGNYSTINFYIIRISVSC